MCAGRWVSDRNRWHATTAGGGIRAPTYAARRWYRLRASQCSGFVGDGLGPWPGIGSASHRYELATMSRIGAAARLAITKTNKHRGKAGMMNRLSTLAQVYLFTVTALVGASTVGIGIWCLVDPTSFADAVNFRVHQHFLHDVGAFQLGLCITLLLALIWADALATALAGFFVANAVHTVNHVMDLDQGGSVAQAWLLGVVSAALAMAFVLRLRQLGFVLGSVATATSQTLAPFVRQKTISLTTFRKDGTPGSSPVSIVVDGDRAYFRSFERAIKVRRIRRNPSVEFGPATVSGKPTGPPQPGSVRLLDGPGYRKAGRLLRQKDPFLHGVLVPSTHRLMRFKFGRTIHAEFVPADPFEASAMPPASTATAIAAHPSAVDSCRAKAVK